MVTAVPARCLGSQAARECSSACLSEALPLRPPSWPETLCLGSLEPLAAQSAGYSCPRNNQGVQKEGIG